MTPQYCGSAELGFVPTTQYGRPPRWSASGRRPYSAKEKKEDPSVDQDLGGITLGRAERPPSEAAFESCVRPSKIAVTGSCSWMLPSPSPSPSPSLAMNVSLGSLPDTWRDYLRSPRSPEASVSHPAPQ